MNYIPKEYKMIRIAVLEDDVRVAKFISMGLRTEDYQVENVSLISDLTDLIQEQQFDILIMDRMIGKSDALNWIKTIKLLSPNIKIIVLSALSGSINRINGLEIGADDYLEKPYQYQELSLRIKKLTSKNSLNREIVIQYDNITLELDSQKIQRAGKTIDLSPYEFKIMVILVKDPYKVHSRTELLDMVWGYGHDTGSNVVDVAIGKLRKKINFDDHLPLISSCRGRGYVFSEKSSI